MSAPSLNLPRLAVAGAAAGVWVTISGMGMAAAFGYREMQQAFNTNGLAIPRGMEPLLTHTAVRLLFGVAIVTLYALLVPTWGTTRALMAATGFAWLLATVLPFAVIVQWGLFSWSLAGKFWIWGAAEFLIAGLIGRWLYRP